MSWKKQGGTNRLDATSNVNLNSVVANKFTIKDYFYGDMNVLGNINADGSMKVKGNLLASYVGAEHIFANLTLKVLRNATVYGSMAVKNDMYVYKRQILGDIERNDNIVTLFTNDSITGNLGITQAKMTDARTGVAELYFDGHIGFGTNDPVATLDITGNIPLTFAVRTDDANNYSIISRNNEDTGVVAHTDLATTEIQFYKETPIPADISGAVPDARIQYIEGGVLAIEAGNSVITYSKSVLTTRDADQIVNNSALTIYDIDNGPFAFDVYNNPNSIKSNAISISGPGADSMSMIHFTNPETNSGISIGGGAYPAHDPPNNSQRMGTIGYTQSDGTYAPTINIVSSATNRLFHRATVGINTQHPRTDEYIMDINGPVIISTTTETNVVQNIPYEIDVLKHCRADHNYIIAVGKPYTVTGDLDTLYSEHDPYDYQQKVYFTRDMGQTWSVSNFNNTDIGASADNAIHAAYAYDASLCFVCTQRGFMYYSVNGGTDWYGIGGLPNNNNIHSVFLTDIFVDSYAVYRVFVCGGDICTWFDMPTSYYNQPETFVITSESINSNFFMFPESGCQTADGLDQIIYITIANSIYSYAIDDYDSNPTRSFISWMTTTGDSYVAMSISQNSAMFVGPGLMTYTNDGGTTYVNSAEPLLEHKILNSVFLEDDVRTTALISGYDTNPDSIGAFFMYSTDQFATFNIITVENLKYFGAPPHVLESQQLYDAFLVSPESIMFFDIVQNYNPNELPPQRGESTIYNLYLPHIFTPGGSRSTSNGAAFRVDYGVSQFGDDVVMEKDVQIDGILTTAGANLANTNLDSAYLYGQTSIHDQLYLYGNISINGILIAPIQLTYINDVTQDIQAQLNEKLGKNENTTVNGQLTFSGTNTFSGSNTFDNLRVASAGLTTVISPDISYNITPTKLSYLRNLSSDVQAQLADKLSLSANGSVLNGTYTFNGQINIANTVVVAGNDILYPSDFGAMKGATSNFQAQLDVMKITMTSISGGAATTILDSAMVANVVLNTFTVPNQFNQNTTIIGNVIVYNSAATMITITPNQLSHLSSVTSNIQTQLNNRVSLNNSLGIDISGIISSAAGFTTALDISANTVKTQYQILSGTSSVNTNTTLTAAQSGSIVNISSALALTLPTPTTSGLWFMLYNSWWQNSVISTPSGAFKPYPGASTITLLPYSTVQVRSNGTDWVVIGGTYDCARISSANVSVGDYSTAGSISASTNLTIAGKAAIGKSTVSTTDTLDVSGSMHVKGNSFIEGRNLTWGNLDVSGAATISNSVSIGKTTASSGIEFDLSGDALISGTLGIGRICSAPYVADISGGIHGTSLAIDNGVTVGSTMTVTGAATFSSNVGIRTALDVSGAISATTLAASTLTLSGNPSGGYSIDCSGSIRAKTITLTDGGTMSIPSGGVADTALSTNVALLNRTSQTFTGDNNFKYISVGGALKPTGGTTTYALDISGGLRITSGTVVFPDGAITYMNLPANTCFKSGSNLFLDLSGTTTPSLGIGKTATSTNYNVDVAGSMNADGPIYAKKLGINKTRTITGGIETTITAGIDVDISGTAAISNTLNIGQKLTVGTPSIVVASATLSKRSGSAYDLYWTTITNSSDLSIQLSPIFTAINFTTRKITYTPYQTAGTYTITYVFDYTGVVTNHTITVYPNYSTPSSMGTPYLISVLSSTARRGTYSATANLVGGMTTGTMYVDISVVGTNLIVNTQSIIVSLAIPATTDANTPTPSSATNSVPLSINGASVFNAPTRFSGGVYADTAQTIHFGANAPIMSGTNILPGTIPSTAFATSGVDLGSDQTVSGTKTFANNLIVSSPSRLLVGTAAVNANRNSVITADISGGIAASKYMTVGTTTLLNMVSKRADNLAFTINNGDVFGVVSSAAAVRTYSNNLLNAQLVDISNVRLTQAFAVSGYYTFTMVYTPTPLQVVSGLVYNVDFKNPLCYSGGSTFKNLVNNSQQNITNTNTTVGYEFDSVTNTLKIKNTNTALVADSAYTYQTISLWFKANAYGDNKYLFDGRNDSPLPNNIEESWIFCRATGTDGGGSNWKNVYKNGDSTLLIVNSFSAQTPLNTWVNLTFIADTTYTGKMTFFSRYNNVESLSCDIAAIMVYNRVLTATENKQNYDYYLNILNNQPANQTTDRFTSNVILSPVNGNVVSNTPLATLDLSANTTASSTIYLAGGMPNNIRVSAPNTVSGLSIYQISLKIDYRYDNTTLGYNMAVNGDQAVFGKIVPYFGIDASSAQTINFGANAPAMSGAGIAAATIPSTSIAGTVALLGATQTFTGTNTFQTTNPANINCIQVNRNVGGVGTFFSNNSGYIGFYNGPTTYWTIAPDGTPSFKANSITDGTLSTNVALLAGSQSFSGLNTFAGGIKMNLSTIYLALDTNHYLAYEPVSGVGMDGPSLRGWAGGALGTNIFGTQNSLTWSNTAVNVFKQLNAIAGINVGASKIRYVSTNMVFGNTTYNESLGTYNVCFGVETMQNASNSNLVGNVGIGYQTLKNVSSSGNVGIGFQILVANTTGYDNIGIGNNALIDNVDGHDNTGFGHEALRKNISGSFNVGIGYQALYWATNSHNVGIGYQAACNTTGYGNVAVGTNTLSANTSGSSNVAIGYDALKSNTVGTYNTCVGYNANVTSNNLSFSTAIGVSAQITTSHQIVLGTADEYVFIPGSLRMNISPIHLYGDTYHYLKYGAGEDGPVLRGFAGGALGTTYPAVKNVLTWNTTCVSTNQLPLRLYSATDNDYRIQYRSDSKTEITGYVGGVLGTTSGTAKDILAWNTDSVIVYTSLSLSGGNSYLSAVGVNVGASKIRYNNNNFVFTGTGETPNYNEAVGSNNICLGKQPMGNASGNPVYNIAMGFGALFLATNTFGTIALGASAARNMIGNYNVAIGHDALNGIQLGTTYDTAPYGSGDTSGTNNVAVGHSAGTVCRSGNNNTFLGGYADIDAAGHTFNNSTALGYNAKITASNQIMLGTASETVVMPNAPIMSGASITARSISIGSIKNTGSSEGYMDIQSSCTFGFYKFSTDYWSWALEPNGNVWGTHFNTISDARKKTNIVNLPSVLDKIKRIHPRSFTWIDTNREDDGFIAQEIFEVFPALNPMSHDDRFTDKLNPVDESGNIVVLGVDYGKLTPYLWGGLKETLQLVETQQSQIDAQQSQITSLQSQIDELRQMVLAMSNK